MSGTVATENDPIAITVRELVLRISVSRRVIPLFAATGLALAVAAWLLLPRTYTSETTLLPSSGDDAMALPGGLLSMAGSLGIQVPGAAVPESHLFPAILKSERVLRTVLSAPTDASDPGSGTIYDRVVDTGVRPEARMEATIARVREEILRVGLDEETGIVRVTVAMDDPALAHRTAGVLVSELERYLATERSARSRHNLEFITLRREEASAQLAAAETRLRDFRDRNRRITNSPDLMLEEGRLFREVRVQEEVFLELTRQMEIVGIEAEKSTPILEVLDPPTLHVVPRSPKLPILIGIGGLVGILLGTIVAALLDSPRLNLRAIFTTARLLWSGRA